MSAVGAIDHRVGSRIRERRIMLGLGLKQLAEMIGLSHQQVQKYEHGIDRVSAGRLFEIACALSVPIAYFFEGIGEESPQTITPHERMPLDVVRNVAEIRSEEQQEAVSELVRALAST
jgi:transcriptional regulator with XRE-family HTH domain